MNVEKLAETAFINYRKAMGFPIPSWSNISVDAERDAWFKVAEAILKEVKLQNMCK